MAPDGQFPTLERPAWFDGQRLEAADFSALFAHPRAVRWLHNRTLHGWGIGAGFDVIAARGDRFVRVDPGYAIDCMGHDLVLSEAVTLPVPQIGGESNGDPKPFVLVATYLDDFDLPRATSRAGECRTNGAVRRHEQPQIRWLDPLAGYRPGYDIALARVTVKNCRLDADPDRSVRPDLTARVGPYIAQGVSPVVDWEAADDGVKITGVRAVIDTTAGAFRRTPLYFATVIGPRVTESPWFILDGPVAALAPAANHFDAWVQLPTGAFVGAQPLNPASVINNPSQLVDVVRNGLRWKVAWIGIEA